MKEKDAIALVESGSAKIYWVDPRVFIPEGSFLFDLPVYLADETGDCKLYPQKK